MKILVTGASGQLGTCIQEVAAEYENLEWIFASSIDLDITDVEEVSDFFSEHQPDTVINCAAYTAVDKAENHAETVYNVNAEAVRILSEQCKFHNAVLVHISTDFVFDGTAKEPYKITDATNPLGVYGASKLKGETYVQEILDTYFIIRTSWVYSEFGGNFMKTMLRLAETKNELNVVADQIGAPTYAMDLAKFLVEIVSSKSTNYGIYHYSNKGSISWHTFASAIFEYAQKDVVVHAIPTTEYPTPAKRPEYSVLDTSNTIAQFKVDIPDWKTSLQNCLKKYL
ncbi:dTDP-4-dehydrorhamnose reductase [Neptunitalea lumnitzerae]|uniref:dTDP-4-dehydrorhamnose reductase n=1 Tax=Neptunitalea lumnitzerae TaxID=2965509 RepID=A0ABQ5MFK8_9FLAO|nr:dTDP-4-dehydrorhamnose reductase [Neptunitalea sp. Y10]GLB48142.1 NAD(P)-dependent oxidoreductase [Neptunitalea sp. Y10]